LVLLFKDSKKILIGKEKNSSNKVSKVNKNRKLLTTHSSRGESHGAKEFVEQRLN
jgi:hypothetical protein